MLRQAQHEGFSFLRLAPGACPAVIASPARTRGDLDRFVACTLFHPFIAGHPPSPCGRMASWNRHPGTESSDARSAQALESLPVARIGDPAGEADGPRGDRPPRPPGRPTGRPAGWERVG